jgi:hypothetical protein
MISSPTMSTASPIKAEARNPLTLYLLSSESFRRRTRSTRARVFGGQLPARVRRSLSAARHYEELKRLVQPKQD